MKSVIVVLSVFLSFAISVTISVAATGDILYVQGSTVNMRKGPSTKHSVIIQLNRGHKLIEMSRQGSWIEVGADGTGGKIGWIHSSLVGDRYVGSPVKSSDTPQYRNFKAAFNRLNEKIERSTGYKFFTGTEYLGDGIVQVTATDIWLSAPEADRRSNLRTIYDMWDAAENTGLPIAVYVVDKRGNQRMSMKT